MVFEFFNSVALCRDSERFKNYATVATIFPESSSAFIFYFALLIHFRCIQVYGTSYRYSFLKGCPVGSTPFKASNFMLPSSNSKFPHVLGSNLGVVPVPLVSLFIHTVPHCLAAFFILNIWQGQSLWKKISANIFE